MQRVYRTKLRAYRFFRWDGKAASAFNSLKRVVNIARLSSRIVDASLLKSQVPVSPQEVEQNISDFGDLDTWNEQAQEPLSQKIILLAERVVANRRFAQANAQKNFTKGANNFVERRFIFTKSPFGLVIVQSPFCFTAIAGIFLEIKALLQGDTASFCDRFFYIHEIMFLNNGKRTTT